MTDKTEVDSHNNDSALVRATESMQGAALPLVAVPQGTIIANLAPHMPTPFRPTGVRKFSDLDSFLDYWNRYSDENESVMYGRVSDPEDASIVAVFNNGQDFDNPGWGDYGAAYEFKLSFDFRPWASITGKNLTQDALVEFLDEHIGDIAVVDGWPTPGDLLDVVKHLKVHRNINVESSATSHTGSSMLTYVETVRGKSQKGEIEIPERFLIKVTPYRGCPPVEFEIDMSLQLTPVDNGVRPFFKLKIRHYLIVLSKLVNDECERISATVNAYSDVPRFFYGN